MKSVLVIHYYHIRSAQAYKKRIYNTLVTY